jgi:hypothetical protein
VAQGNLAEALTAFRASLAIRQRLAKRDPDNADWQLDLVTAHWRLANQNDEAPRRWAMIVGILTKLKGGSRLRPDWEKWLPIAEANLAMAKPQ